MAESWLILLLPFSAFLINGLWLGKRNWKAAATLASASLACTAIVAFYLAQAWLKHPQTPEGGFVASSFEWLKFSDDSYVTMGIWLDGISIMMLVVVSVIGFLVHIYSAGYMKDDPSAGRFFALLPLFCFSMLGLVSAVSLVQMYIFWELVGVSSYLLIGFWYQKPSAVSASKKAFIVTRFADAFFLLGVLIVGYAAKSFDLSTINQLAFNGELSSQLSLGFASFNLVSLAALLIFIGGWGKSAMFPLHIWLPDAMEGPTPVSSIIHSATMVVAGIYLVARLFPLFAVAGPVLEIVRTVGVSTAVFAAIVACTQNDIKRILAFSTLSQLGYMMFALGACQTEHGGGMVDIVGFQASMFHIFTHAAFKCMLFLMAGVVIHAVHTNNIWEMGGLRKKLPVSYVCALVGCVALAGVPPLSGFFSKDLIILAALQNGHSLTAVLGLLTGGLTAFYMFRLFFTVFHGAPYAPRHHGHDAHNAHEAFSGENLFMALPMAALIVPSVAVGGLLEHSFLHFIYPPFVALAPEHAHHPEWLPYLASSLGLLGIFGAWLIYGRKNSRSTAGLLSRAWGPLYIIVKDKLYIDEIYLYLTHQIIFRFVATPVKWFDRQVVDASMNLIGHLCEIGGFFVRLMQSGQVQWYMAAFFFGVFAVFYFGGLAF